jgi:hypothetical protein
MNSIIGSQSACQNQFVWKQKEYLTAIKWVVMRLLC